MTYISTPSQTAGIYQANDRPEPPVITAVAKESETAPFVLGPDTCGFTAGSTRYECSNVDNYRGCCVAGAEDCSATIYTGCVNYEEMPDAAMCGPHTLCCPESKAYCATYAFTTDEQPGATLTHVQCAESPIFGEMYPYPPELSTAAEDPSAENTSSALVVQPADIKHSSSSDSISSGAIVGIVIGSVVFVALIFVGVSLLICQRRRRREDGRRNGSVAMKMTPPPTQDGRSDDNALTAHLRPLSTIPEQRSPLPSSTSLENQEGPAPNTLLPRSFGENWPLGPGVPMSPRKPLSSHPVTDFEKRLTQNEFPSQLQYNSYRESGVPSLRSPTPPSPGTRLSPPPQSRKSELAHGPKRVSTIGLALKSPRVSYIPPPTIDTAFGEEVERTLNSICEPGHEVHRKSGSASSEMPFFATGVNNKKLTNNGVYIHANLGISGISNDFGPRSKLEREEHSVGDQHFDSVPSTWRNTGRGELDLIVSPVGPDELDSSCPCTPMTVSPLESRKGSFGV
ncbi:hypothetical protein F4678DRAFT_483692 [Xylaria arbuscula]|nr:hypothetical protein F4678DRAFT_483692 [Xylaria arbuscula]